MKKIIITSLSKMLLLLLAWILLAFTVVQCKKAYNNKQINATIEESYNHSKESEESLIIDSICSFIETDLDGEYYNRVIYDATYLIDNNIVTYSTYIDILIEILTDLQSGEDWEYINVPYYTYQIIKRELEY